MTDEQYYKSVEQQNAIRAKALSKARYRGEISVQWHMGNKLNSQTLPDFKKAMKQADKDWELNNRK